MQRWRQIERDAKDKVDIDKLAPGAAAPPPKPNQRSDASEDVFGTLPTNVLPVSYGSVAAFSDPAVSHDIANVTAAGATTSLDSAARRHARKGRPALESAAMAASLDTFGFSVEGDSPKGSALLDGPPTNDAAAAAPAAPQVASLKPQEQLSKPQEQTARKAALDSAATDAKVDLFADPDPASTAPAHVGTPPLHPKIYDVSEGTPLDPLNDKTYDLNSGKTIPSDLVHP